MPAQHWVIDANFHKFLYNFILVYSGRGRGGSPTRADIAESSLIFFSYYRLARSNVRQLLLMIYRVRVRYLWVYRSFVNRRDRGRKLVWRAFPRSIISGRWNVIGCGEIYVFSFIFRCYICYLSSFIRLLLCWCEFSSAFMLGNRLQKSYLDLSYNFH